MAVGKGGKPRLIDVAEMAGVSLGTVSNTINRPYAVSERTRKKVEAAIKKLDFVRNEGAASLRSGTSRTLGLVIPDLANGFYAEIAKGVVAAAEEQDYAVLMFNTDDDPERELRQFEILARHRTAGALIVPRSADHRRLERLRTFGMRMVLVDRVASEHDGCSVAIDDVRGGLLAATHLLKAGRKQIVFVNGPTEVPQASSRREGLGLALGLAGIAGDAYAEVHMDNTTYADGERAAREVMALPELPQGVFCINDQLAIGMMRELATHGVRVPEQVAIVGYGDSSIAEGAPLGLTTIRQPMFELGRAAVGKLLREVDESPADHRHSSSVFTPSLVVRASAP